MMIKHLAAMALPLLAGVAYAEDHFSYAIPKDHPGIPDIVSNGGCAPKDNMARVLKSSHPLDYAANWSGNNYIGTGWTFMPSGYVVDPDMSGGIYLEGHLITPRGAEMPDDLFIVFAEWDCAVKKK
jgi:hypothetical protein